MSPASLSLTPAVAGSDRPTSTRAVFHGPTHGSAIGASQPLDHGSGTVCQPGFASPTTTSENFASSWSRFCLIDTAAHSDYCSYAPVKYSYSLTHSVTFCTFAQFKKTKPSYTVPAPRTRHAVRRYSVSRQCISAPSTRTPRTEQRRQRTSERTCCTPQRGWYTWTDHRMYEPQLHCLDAAWNHR